jgi:hypothetical protein
VLVTTSKPLERQASAIFIASDASLAEFEMKTS